MAKPDRSRYIWLYFKSKAQKDEWQALAEKADTPLSTWCALIIEERIAENEEHRPRHKIAKELEAVMAENKSIRKDLRQKEIVLQGYEAELLRYGAEPFQIDAFQGVRPYSKELVDILKALPHVRSCEILELLGIRTDESQAINAVSKQLEELEKFNLVRADGKGWQWIV